MLSYRNPERLTYAQIPHAMHTYKDPSSKSHSKLAAQASTVKADRRSSSRVAIQISKSALSIKASDQVTICSRDGTVGALWEGNEVGRAGLAVAAAVAADGCGG